MVSAEWMVAGTALVSAGGSWYAANRKYKADSQSGETNTFSVLITGQKDELIRLHALVKDLERDLDDVKTARDLYRDELTNVRERVKHLEGELRKHLGHGVEGVSRGVDRNGGSGSQG